MIKSFIPVMVSVTLLVVGVLLLAPYATKADTDIGDITPPEVLSVVIDPTIVDTSAPANQGITLTARVVDDVAGLREVCFWFSPKSGNEVLKGTCVRGYSEASTVCRPESKYDGSPITDTTCTSMFPLFQHSPGGLWYMGKIESEDRVGNRRVYTWDGVPESDSNMPPELRLTFLNEDENNKPTPVYSPTPTMTPTPTATTVAASTPTPVCTPPPCPQGGALVCLKSNGCPGGCGVSCQFSLHLPSVRSR